MKLKILLISILFFQSCDKNKQQKSESEKESERKDKLNIQVASFEEIQNTGIIIFPLNMGESKSREYESSSYKETRNFGFWNILFYDSKTNEKHLLTEQKIIISNFDDENNVTDAENLPKKLPFIFYRVIIDDYNKDKVLNNYDPTYLFVSDLQGKNFKQISISNLELGKWKYLESSNKVIYTATKDTDNNLIFDEEDEISTYEFSFKNEKDKVDIVSDTLKNKLKNLYDRDWQVLKKK